MLAPSGNAAAELGPQRFSWWPKWQGRKVAIVACGPSLKKQDVETLRGRLPVLAIKETVVEFCPWADVAYGCDGPWWKYRRGLPDFKGLKFAYDAGACDQYRDIKRVLIPDKFHDRLALTEPLSLGSGGNSGFQILNLAVQFGISGAVLLGFDITGSHFYGRNNWSGSRNPTDVVFKRWLPAFNGAAKQLRSLGIDVVNANRFGALECFRRAALDDVLKEWAL